MKRKGKVLHFAEPPFRMTTVERVDNSSPCNADYNVGHNIVVLSEAKELLNRSYTKLEAPSNGRAG